MTLAEVAQVLHLSRERIRQIEVKALRKLAPALADPSPRRRRRG